MKHNFFFENGTVLYFCKSFNVWLSRKQLDSHQPSDYFNKSFWVKYKKKIQPQMYNWKREEYCNSLFK